MAVEGEGGSMPRHYRLFLSTAAAADWNALQTVDGLAGGRAAPRYVWEALHPLPVRQFEISLLRDRAELGVVQHSLQPAAFGVHWPLLMEDPVDVRLLECAESAFRRTLVRMGEVMAGSGAEYLLVHVPQRGERWPAPPVAAARLEALAQLGRTLGMRVVLEPKEGVGGVPDGVCAFAAHVRSLPAGVALCVDVSDWLTAQDNLGRAPALAVSATHFHHHARHVQPDGPYYRHAPPWVPLPPEPGWTVRNVSPHLLQQLSAGAGPAPVVLCVEVVHRYLPLLPAALRAVRRRMAEMGWVEVDGPDRSAPSPYITP